MFQALEQRSLYDVLLRFGELGGDLTRWESIEGSTIKIMCNNSIDIIRQAKKVRQRRVARDISARQQHEETVALMRQLLGWKWREAQEVMDSDPNWGFTEDSAELLTHWIRYLREEYRYPSVTQGKTLSKRAQRLHDFYKRVSMYVAQEDWAREVMADYQAGSIVSSRMSEIDYPSASSSISR